MKPEAKLQDMDFQISIERFILDLLKKEKVTGLAVGLVHGQDIIYAKGFGYANKKAKQPVTINTCFRAGSVSKLFTAITLLILSDQGKIDLDANLVSYLPELKMQSRFGGMQEVTVRQVLSHHAGFASDHIDGMWSDAPEHYATLVSKLTDDYLAFMPNSLMSYSNLGYGLLAAVIQQVAGMEYPEAVQKLLLEPLNMSGSIVDYHLIGSEVSSPYLKGKLAKEYGLRDIAAGGLNSNVLDMMNFIRFINEQGRFNSKQVLKESTWREMFQAQNENVALDLGQQMGIGWHFYDGILPDSENLVGHDGATVTNRSDLMISLTSKIGVIVLSNDPGKTDSTVHRVAKQIMQQYCALEKEFEHENAAKSECFSDPQSDLEGAYMSAQLGAYFIKPHKKKLRLSSSAIGLGLDVNLNEDGDFYLSRKLLGLLPLNLRELGQTKFRLVNVDGHDLIIGKHNGGYFLDGLKVVPQPIDETWQSRVGKYRLENQLEPSEFHILGLELHLGEGHLLLTMQVKTGMRIAHILNTVDSENAVIAGFGRGMGYNVKAQQINDAEQLHFSGLRFVKEPAKKK